MLTPIILLFRPQRGWQQLAAHVPRSIIAALIYPALFALLPTLAWYNGVTRVGWRIGADAPVRLTEASALPIVVLFYLSMVAAVAAIGCMLHWMAQTYGAASTPSKGIAISALTATPLFVAGAVGFYPLLLLDFIVGLGAICYAVYLLYLGIPIVMQIPKERGFLFASAVIAVCLVIFMMIMGGTVMLWDMGVTPVFTD
jgi:hypothetical protein